MISPRLIGHLSDVYPGLYVWSEPNIFLTYLYRFTADDFKINHSQDLQYLFAFKILNALAIS